MNTVSTTCTACARNIEPGEPLHFSLKVYRTVECEVCKRHVQRTAALWTSGEGWRCAPACPDDR